MRVSAGVGYLGLEPAREGSVDGEDEAKRRRMDRASREGWGGEEMEFVEGTGELVGRGVGPLMRWLLITGLRGSGKLDLRGSSCTHR